MGEPVNPWIPGTLVRKGDLVGLVIEHCPPGPYLQEVVAILWIGKNEPEYEFPHSLEIIDAKSGQEL